MRTCVRCLVVACIVPFLSGAGKPDKAEVYEFNIPRQQVESAMNALATQAQVLLLFPYEQVQSIEANPVMGRYTIEDALDILLLNTGFSGTLTKSDVITISLKTTDIQGEDKVKTQNANTRKQTKSSLIAGIAAFLASVITAPNVVGQEVLGGQSEAKATVLEEIMVTGSRIRLRDGMETPTPVTVVEMEELTLMDPGNVIDAFTMMPQFLNNNAPSTPGSNAGPMNSANVNLRGIGSIRTLVLLDGRRVVSSNHLSTPDVSTFPESMIRGIEIVTGGASAAYGSDAISGAVNFLLDTDYTGVKGHVQGGIASRGDNQNYEFSLSGGHALGERSHFIASVDYFEADSVETMEGRDWYQNWGAVDINGPSQPKIVASDVRSRNYTAGGLIRLPGSALDRVHFLEGGIPALFQDGSIVGANSQVGGTGFMGTHLVNMLNLAGAKVTAPSRKDLDLSPPNSGLFFVRAQALRWPGGQHNRFHDVDGLP